jgi:phospholipid/cholesterol/gamma-HCH transport system substrate-binding protein
MSKENNRYIRLGAFVIAGTLLLITALYFIGTRQNLFGESFHLRARFHNVNGLMRGNNVRFAGIDVGTVNDVQIENDSTVLVQMVIDNKVRPFISRSSVASVGTDGLMGNKLVNINAGTGPALPISQDDELTTLRPLEMDEMVRTLNVTNDNIMNITGNLRHITDRISSRNNLWNLLFDTVVAQNIKSSALNLKVMTSQGKDFSSDLNTISRGVKDGKGDLGKLLNDTSITSDISVTLKTLRKFSDSASIAANNVSLLLQNLRQGKGTAGKLLTDTIVAVRLNHSIQSIDSAAKSFDENMEAMRHSWPFKKYFRKKGGPK